tara:strand:- start:125 stop:616 length:492 start_codon:yes stop_codon:yes gene_type:complete
MKKNYRTLSGLPKFQRDNSSPTGFSSIEAGEDVDMPKPFNHYDPSTYPSNYTPQQKKKLFSEELNTPEIKRLARKFIDKKPPKQKKTPLANNFYVDTTLTKDITAFENKVRQRDEQLKKIRQEQQRQEPLIRPQQYGIGAIDTPTATTLDALALLKIERELKK